MAPRISISTITDTLSGSGSGGGMNGETRSSAWTKRFSRLVQPLQSTAPTLSLKEPDLGRQDSLHVLFHSSFSHLVIEEDTEEDNYDSFCADNAMDTLQKVQDSVDGIFMFLENNGVPAREMEELIQMERRLQYTALLKQAEEYADYLLQQNPHLLGQSDILDLFTLAWTSVHEYSKDRCQQIQKAHSELQLQQWQEQVTRFTQEKDQDQPYARQERLQRQKRNRELMDQFATSAANNNNGQQLTFLKQQLAMAVRFKMECQKHLWLTKEWTTSTQRKIKQRLGRLVIEV